MVLGPRVAALVTALVLLAPGASRGEEEVRIALTSGQAQVEVGGPSVSVFDAETGAKLLSAKGDGRFLVVGAGESLLVHAATSTAAKRPLLAKAKRLLVETEDQVRVEKSVYYGRLELAQERGRGVRVINRLPLETYLLGIVGSEMNPSWPIEALKAQAVAARTYAMQRRQMMRAANEPYDLASTVLSQVYKGAERISRSVIQAVKETRGEVLAYDHDLVEALFHSTCGGHTASAKEIFGREVAYLQSRPCQFCRASERYRWKVSYSLADVSAKLRSASLSGGQLVKFERGAGVEKVSLKDQKGKKTASPKEVRAALGYLSLYSERFTARTVGKKVLIDGNGFGHGVGLCQWGARGRADAGENYRQILEHYYQGARIMPMY